MEITKNQILKEINEITDIRLLVTIATLAVEKAGIKTPSEMARFEGRKQPNGIKKSKNYLKFDLGGQLMCVKGEGIRHNDFKDFPY